MIPEPEPSPPGFEPEPECTDPPFFIEVPNDSTIECWNQVPTNVTLEWHDPCDVPTSGFATSVDQTLGFNCENQKTINRTWNYTNSNQLTATAQQIIMVNDTTPPTIPSGPEDMTVQCPMMVPDAPTLTATDNCDGLITGALITSGIQGDCVNNFIVTRTWTFTDLCGNSATIYQNILINDTTAPTLPSAPEDMTVQCPTLVPDAPTLTATDNCDGLVTGVLTETSVGGECVNNYTLTRTWTFTDLCGNSSSIDQTIVINDTIAPTVPSAPENMTVQCGSGVPSAPTLTATDNCDGLVTGVLTETSVAGDCVNNYTLTRTWTFTDLCGNSSSVDQTIVVNDTTPPTVVCPADLTIECTDSQSPTATGTASANDNCGGLPTITFSDATVTGDCPNSYHILRTWSAVDECDNVATCQQRILVTDTIAPVAPVVIDLTVSCFGDIPPSQSLTATDNCEGLISVLPVDVTMAGGCANQFSLVRTWTFVDSCGNSSQSVQNILVADLIPPTVSSETLEMLADLTVQCVGEVPPPMTVSATDNCGEIIISEPVEEYGDYMCPNRYLITRTWTFADDCENTSEVIQKITVNDDIGPQPSEEVPEDITVECISEIPKPMPLVFTDNCDGEIGKVCPEDYCDQPEWSSSLFVTRLWPAHDSCGNSTVVKQLITVTDPTPPKFECPPPDICVYECECVPESICLEFRDECGVVESVNPCERIHKHHDRTVIQRVWKAKDRCGNRDRVEQTITVHKCQRNNRRHHCSKQHSRIGSRRYRLHCHY